MDSRLQALLDAAFSKSPAAQANAQIDATRVHFAELAGGPSWSYEVLVPEGASSEFLLKDTLPRLTYFLHSHGTPQGEGVFLSLFYGDQLYFIAVPDALALFCEWSGMTLDDMKARWQDGFSAPSLALPEKT